MAALSIAISSSSFKCSVRICHDLFLLSPFLPLPPLTSTAGAGLGRGCSNAWMSLLILVSSCSASSKVHPSACNAAISCQSLRSACRSSVVLTVRSPESAGRCEIVDLLVKCAEYSKVGPSAHCDCIAENPLGLGEPCGVQVSLIYRLVRSVIE